MGAGAGLVLCVAGNWICFLFLLRVKAAVTRLPTAKAPTARRPALEDEMEEGMVISKSIPGTVRVVVLVESPCNGSFCGGCCCC